MLVIYTMHYGIRDKRKICCEGFVQVRIGGKILGNVW
jgi:hypothetical protein